MVKGKRRKGSRRKSTGIDLTPYFYIGAAVVLGITINVIYHIHHSEKTLIPFHVLLIVAGMLIEYKRLVKKWSKVLMVLVFAFPMSLMALLPGRNEKIYNFELHAELWPYAFILIFLGIAILNQKEKLTPKLTEGITLVQSIAVIYWTLALGFHLEQNRFIQVLLAIGVLLALFSFLHAFSTIKLSRNNRFLLSLWSSLTMMILAFDHIYRVYQNELIERTDDPAQAGFVALQFFLLGISSIYIFHNSLMILGFFPERDAFFNRTYFEKIRKLKEDHITRYSDVQVKQKHALLIAIVTSSFFAFNLFTELLHPQLAIWLVFLSVPVVAYSFATLESKR